MLKSWTLANFKSVCSPTTLEMAPLTVLTGANSSGKSTILQSILLITQSLNTRIDHNSLILNGPLIKAGFFDDIRSTLDNDPTVRIGFRLEFPFDLESVDWGELSDSAPNFALGAVDCHLSFAVTDPSDNLQQVQPSLGECTFSAEGWHLEPSVISYPEDENSLMDVVESSPETQAVHFRIRKPSDTNLIELTSLAEEIVFSQRIRYLDVNSDPDAYYPTDGSLLPEPVQPLAVKVDKFLPNTFWLVYDASQLRRRSVFELILRTLRSGTAPWDARELSQLIGGAPDPDFLQTLADRVLSLLVTMQEDPSGQWTPPDWPDRSEAVLGVIEESDRRRLRRSTSEIDAEDAVATVRDSVEASRWLLSDLRNRVGPESLRMLLYGLSLLTPAASEELARRWSEDSEEILGLLPEHLPPSYKFRRLRPKYLVADAVKQIERSFVGLKYLGPLRDEPKPVYPLPSSADTQDVGLKGEFTASVLQVHRQTTVSHFPPDILLTSAIEDEPAEAALLDAVREWLQYLGVASDLTTVERGSLGRELKVASHSGDISRDLTHVGVGVSQILPILVLGLLAGKDSILVFEQPELHLHPRVQSRLADFFFSMTLLGKQCIVETHSEYIINRLRYLAALPWGDRVSRDTLVYFVEKDSGQSSFRPIRINRFGVIEDWPRGFFDESEEISAAILKAVLDKRKGGTPRSDA